MFMRCLNSAQPLTTVNCDVTQTPTRSTPPSAGQNVKLKLRERAALKCNTFPPCEESVKETSCLLTRLFCRVVG